MAKTEVPFGLEGDLGGRMDGQTNEQTDNGFKGVRLLECGWNTFGMPSENRQ